VKKILVFFFVLFILLTIASICWMFYSMSTFSQEWDDLVDQALISKTVEELTQSKEKLLFFLEENNASRYPSSYSIYYDSIKQMNPNNFEETIGGLKVVSQTPPARGRLYIYPKIFWKVMLITTFFLITVGVYNSLKDY